MGIISKLIGAGLKKTKPGIKEYQEGITKRAIENRKKQLIELNTKLAKSKTPKDRAKLVGQIKHVKSLQVKYDKLPKGLGGKTMATKKKKPSKKVPTKATKMQSTDFKKKGLSKVKDMAKKSSAKKIRKTQAERRAASEPTVKDLVDQLGELEMHKKQVD